MIFNTPEFKVGLLVLVVSGLIAVMSLKISENPSALGRSKQVWFLLEDASGLVKNSNVKMAGIDVGIIRDITLEDGQARVDLLVRPDIPLTKSSRIEIRPNGILGDKHVEVISGDPRDPPLRSGEQILIVDDRASVDRLISEVSKITKSLSAVADNIKAATEGESDKPLGKIIKNIEILTSDLAEMSQERKGQIGEILDNLDDISTSLNDMINDESDEGLKKSWKDAMAALRRIEKTVHNVEEITDKVNRGEGTIGKLINDERTVEELNTAIEGVNNFLDASNKIQTSIDFHSEYLSDAGTYKSYLGLNIQPGLDRYYEIAIVDDPKGVSETTQTTTTSSTGSTDVTETKRYKYKVKFTALFAKNVYNFSLKGGVIENTGGVGIDYFFFKKKFRLALEAFDFENFHARASLRYSLVRGIYLLGGADDLFSRQGNVSAFVGGGIFLTNDDLKLLVSRMPF